MALVVRNTFLHFTHEEDEDSLHHGRSNSAPPACRQTKRDKGDYDSTAVSTTCETLELDASTIASDIDDVESQFACTEHEDLSPAMSGCDSDSDDDDAAQQHNSALTHVTLSPEAVQQQLEQMSQKVMDIWSKLRSIEAQCGDTVAVATPAENEREASQFIVQPDVKQVGSAPVPGHAAGRQLDGKACPFIPSGTSGEIESVLDSVKQVLMIVPGVAAVEVKLGRAGTLATVSIRLDSKTSESKVSDSVIAASKSAFLEFAANSQSVYVLGYEAEPFQEDPSGSGFSTTLALMPTAWECSACWDVYQKGFCHRRKTCKWQHPGRNELQPVRVVVY